MTVINFPMSKRNYRSPSSSRNAEVIQLPSYKAPSKAEPYVKLNASPSPFTASAASNFAAAINGKLVMVCSTTFNECALMTRAAYIKFLALAPRSEVGNHASAELDDAAAINWKHPVLLPDDIRLAFKGVQK